MRKPYPMDLSDDEWNYTEPHMPSPNIPLPRSARSSQVWALGCDALPRRLGLTHLPSTTCPFPGTRHLPTSEKGAEGNSHIALAGAKELAARTLSDFDRAWHPDPCCIKSTTRNSTRW